jgi:hypothetical protein
MPEENKNRPDLIAYAVSKGELKSHFHQIGAAWANTKGGYGLRLFALPVDGEIVLLPPSDNSEPETP